MRIVEKIEDKFSAVGLKENYLECQWSSKATLDLEDIPYFGNQNPKMIMAFSTQIQFSSILSLSRMQNYISSSKKLECLPDEKIQ